MVIFAGILFSLSTEKVKIRTLKQNPVQIDSSICYSGQPLQNIKMKLRKFTYPFSQNRENIFFSQIFPVL